MAIVFIVLSGIVIIFCFIVICIRIFLLVVTVQHASMSPTLMHGDRVLALRNVPKGWLRKGQIVLIWPLPGVPIPVPAGYQEPPYIKRIAATAGETYTLAPDEKVLAISPDHPRAWHIPPDHVFVRGDSHAAGMDSTAWGPVPFRNIFAVVLMKLPSM